VNFIQAALEPLRNVTRAAPMSAYMREQFPFLGIAAPARVKAVKAAFQAQGLLKAPLNSSLVLELWALPEREYQYAACDYMHWRSQALGFEHLDLLEHCVTTKSWWDTVDSLDQAAGEIALRHPEAVARLEVWSTFDNFWLRRFAIQHQLAYKAQTDQARLFRFILANAFDTEFFIRKSIGWALREYSYTDPEAVQRFVFEHPELSNLSKREALKAIGRKQAKAVQAP
jgi:3-methyladenine DNA glycosylase AlkD